MDRRVVILMGSESDLPYTDHILEALRKKGYNPIRRIASAHRTPNHLQLVLDQCEQDGIPTIYVTVAGLSDALSGTVAARASGRVVACPPDADDPGKQYSSTRLPGKAVVWYTRGPSHAATQVDTLFLEADFSQMPSQREAFRSKAAEVMQADARLQGAEHPLPHTYLGQGKTRELYDGGGSRDLGDGTLLIQASDRVSAFDQVMAERVPGKGEALTDLADFWFSQTETLIPHHFRERVDARTIRVQRAERVNIEWIVRGFLYGSLARDYQKGERILYGITLSDGLRLADPLPDPILTATTKADKGHDQPLTREEAIAQGLVSPREWNDLEGWTHELYRRYSCIASSRGIIIPDFKVEFGRTREGLIQIDEPPNHDSARLWARAFYVPGQKQEGHALDKEFLRQFLLEQGYQGDGPPPHLPPEVVDQIARRVRGATDVLLGKADDVESLGLVSVEEMVAQVRR
ncbi:MAG: AIR carboxylase family protein [Candidatus Aenigmarchaeota archaeon]|nr:AIR carboxylase family protein [Candidatus Aenigmarchaeota archaeon]